MDWLQDLRYAARMMKKNPGFSAAVCLIVALGVGSNTAIFSVVKGVLLSPLPFEEPDRLAIVRSWDKDTGNPASVAYPDFLDWRDQADLFENLAAFNEEDLILTGGNTAERLSGELVSSDYFPVLKQPAWRGRTFTEEENKVGSGSTVTVLSHGLWRRRFGSDPEMVGKTIHLNGREFTVVGIMPPGFRGFEGTAEIWVPISLLDVVNPEVARYEILTARWIRWHRVVGRLEPGVTLEQSQAEMDAIAGNLGEAYPEFDGVRGIRLFSAYDDVVGSFRPSLLVLASAVGLVLLIACANLANLFLSRLASRTREVAVRISLGATRKRMVRQLLTESILFALIGGILGLVFARWSIGLLVALAPVELPSFADVTIDGTVLIFTAAISIITGVAFGLFPAFGSTQTKPGEFLKEATRMSGAGLQRRSARGILIVAEVSLAVLLLVSAALMVKSFQKMHQFDPGFNSETLLTMRFDLVEDGSGVETTGQLKEIVDRASSLPGVESAALSSHIFYGRGYMTSAVSIEGYVPPEPDQDVLSYVQFVGPEFFKTLRIPLLQGRAFTSSDEADAPPVVIVNQSFAQELWPNQIAIGKRLIMGKKTPDRPWNTVVGVVSDVQPRIRPDGTPLHQVYFPVMQGGDWSRCLVVKTATEPTAAFGSLRAAIREVSPNIAVFSISSMEQLLSKARSQTRFIAILMGAFSLLALCLAVVGVYGVVSYSVSRAGHEIGIRVALGAQSQDVLGLFMKRAAFFLAVGLALGLCASFAATRFLTGILYEVSPLDANVFVLISVGLALIVGLASYLPARRASRLDPLAALRYE